MILAERSVLGKLGVACLDTFRNAALNCGQIIVQLSFKVFRQAVIN
jgi:hypothetical protein